MVIQTSGDAEYHCQRGLGDVTSSLKINPAIKNVAANPK